MNSVSEFLFSLYLANSLSERRSLTAADYLTPDLELLSYFVLFKMKLMEAIYVQ